MNDRSYISRHKGHDHFLTDAEIDVLRGKVKSARADRTFLEIMRNLCDPTKLAICTVLTDVSEISVADLAAVTGVTQSAVSHALADLREAGIVDGCRCGKLTCYSFADNAASGSVRRTVGTFLLQVRV